MTEIIIYKIATVLLIVIVGILAYYLHIKSQRLKRFQDRFALMPDEEILVWAYKVNGEIVDHITDEFNNAPEKELKEKLEKIKESVSEKDKVELVRLSASESKRFLDNL